MASFNRVYAVGMGVQTPISFSTQSFAEEIFGAPQLNRLGQFSDAFDERLVRTKSESPIFGQVAEEQFAKTFRTALLGTKICGLTALQAVEMSGLKLVGEKKLKWNLMIAGTNFNSQSTFEGTKKFLESGAVDPKYGYMFLDTDSLGRISEVLKIEATGFSIGGASASGLVGLVHAYECIHHGMFDVCLVSSPHADIALPELKALALLKAAVSSDPNQHFLKESRPFDKSRHGFVLGHGAGSVLLVSERIMEEQKLKPLAEIRGCGFSLDCNHLTNPSVESEVRVMKAAMDKAKVQACDVSFVNCHGTASVLGDQIELSAVKEVFGGGKDSPYINSTKAIIGHCLFSAGLVETIGVILQLEKGQAHGNPGLQNPFVEDQNLVGVNAIPLKSGVALKNSFGFGGINSSMVLSRT